MILATEIDDKRAELGVSAACLCREAEVDPSLYSRTKRAGGTFSERTTKRLIRALRDIAAANARRRADLHHINQRSEAA